MSRVILDGSIQTTTTTIYSGSPVNLFHNVTDAVTRVESVFIPSSSNPDHGYNVSSNSSLMGNASVEETNPRLVNGVVNLLLMLFNIGGNGLVLYVYHSLFTNTVFNLFVKALASLDLMTAVTTMLIDVIMKLRENNEDQLNTTVMCKLSHYQVYANSMASGCVLTLIAYQRYRKICHPLRRGMQLRKAKILLACIGAICLIISIPTLFLYGSTKVKVLVRSTEVHATICRSDRNFQNTPLFLVFSYFLMATFCLVLVSTCVLYCMVSRSIRNFEKRSSAILNAPSPTTPSPGHDTMEEDLQYGVGGYRNSPLTTKTLATSPVHGRNPIQDPYHNRRTPQSPYSHNAGAGRQVQTPTTPNARKHSYSQTRKLSTFTMATTGNVISTQMYRVFSIITVVFIISYLPHLVALTLTKVLNLDDKVLTYGQRMALEFAYNCPYISTVSNPLIYGFSSSEFRDRVRELLESCNVFCCCCWCCVCCCDNDHDKTCVCCDVFDCCDKCACCNED